MDMGGDSRSRGRVFESWHRILYGHFSLKLLYLKIVMFALKDRLKRMAILDKKYKRQLLLEIFN